MDLPAAAAAIDLASGMRSLSRAEQTQRLEEAAQGFEALFLNEMLKAQRSASFGDTLFDSSAMETTQSMLDSAISETSSRRSGLGIGRAIYEQFRAQIGNARDES